MEPVFSDWLTGTLSDEGWGPRDDKIVQFASHYFLYFPIFHLKYSYILSFRIPIFLFFLSKKSLGALDGDHFVCVDSMTRVISMLCIEKIYN